MSRRKRILLVVRWPDGGIRTHIRYFYRLLSPEKYDFAVIGPKRGLARIREDLSMHSISCYGAKSDSTAAFFAATASVFVTQRFDIVHSHGLTSAAAAVPWSRLTATPHLLTAHDVFLPGQFAGPRGTVRRHLVKSVLQSSENIQFVGSDVSDNWKSAFPAIEKSCKLTTIRSGVEIERFHDSKVEDLKRQLSLAADTRLFGFLGRFMAQKGFVDIIHAVRILRDRGIGDERMVVLCVGADGYIREDRNLIRRLGLDSYFRFLDFRPDVGPVIRGLDAVLMPSRWEALGLLAMECMVAGTPLIASNCIGLREVVAGSAATIVPPSSPEALAEAMCQYVHNLPIGPARAFAGEAARVFDVRPAAAALGELYEQLMPS